MVLSLTPQPAANADVVSDGSDHNNLKFFIINLGLRPSTELVLQVEIFKTKTLEQKSHCVLYMCHTHHKSFSRFRSTGTAVEFILVNKDISSFPFYKLSDAKPKRIEEKIK